jgi:hypothetical protein
MTPPAVVQQLASATGRKLLLAPPQQQSGVKAPAHQIERIDVQSASRSASAALAAMANGSTTADDDALLGVLEHLSSVESSCFGSGRYLAADCLGDADLAAAGSSSSSSRDLLVVQDELDPFRRAQHRSACAEAAAKSWRPFRLFNLTDDVNTNPRYQQTLAEGDVVQIISSASAALNRKGYGGHEMLP